MLELYFILMKNNVGNHKYCKTLIKHGKIQVNGEVETNPKRLIYEDDHITYQGNILNSQPLTYIMMHKPQGYICANKDDKYKCVIDLLENKDVFCLGRLDIDTTGLLLLTNDVRMKKLLMPQYHVEKTYLVETLQPLHQEDAFKCKEGIIIDGNVKCKSANMTIIDDDHCLLTLTEGKYHQVKKMMLSLGNQVISLHRHSFAGIALDKNLKEGQYRILDKEERQRLYEKIK